MYIYVSIININYEHVYMCVSITNKIMNMYRIMNRIMKFENM